MDNEEQCYTEHQNILKGSKELLFCSLLTLQFLNESLNYFLDVKHMVKPHNLEIVETEHGDGIHGDERRNRR
jgi:hypothetical protein